CLPFEGFEADADAEDAVGDGAAVADDAAEVVVAVAIGPGEVDGDFAADRDGIAAEESDAAGGVVGEAHAHGGPGGVGVDGGDADGDGGADGEAVVAAVLARGIGAGAGGSGGGDRLLESLDYVGGHGHTT